MMSSSQNYCPTCEQAIPSFAPGGNCPRCLFRKPAIPAGGDDQDEALPRIENVRVHGLIGEGGFGMVYRGTQVKPVQREVAIKVLKKGLDGGQVLARFEAERQALAMMNHPNIARIYDAGETADGQPFFTMELVEGLPLNRYCVEKLPDLESRLKLFLDACEAVTHAHQKGLIHRDLKPSNILVGDRLKVIDFGIAKATENVLSEATLITGEAQMLGTPEYMSPEQADGGSLGLDTRTDVYSLGAVLYELVAGSPPFTGHELRARGLAEILRVIREDEPPRPSTRMTKVSREDESPGPLLKVTSEVRNDLDWIVMQALNKDRERRYDTVSGFAKDIRNFLNREPVSARPPSFVYRLSKFVSKHRAGTLAAIVVLLSVVSAAVVGTVMAIRAEEARKTEARERERADQATYEVKRTFSHSDLLIADGYLDRGQPGNAVAYLARALRTDPGNQTASLKLMHTMAGYSFAREVRDPVLLDERPSHLFLNPDGTWTLAVSARGHVNLHETFSGKTLGSFRFRNDGFTLASANRDLSRVVVGSQQGLLKLYRLPEGEELAKLQVPNSRLLRSLLLSEDGGTIFAGGHDGVVRAFDAESQKVRWKFAHEERVICLDFSPDESRLLCGYGDGTVSVLRASDGEVILKKKCHSAPVVQVAFLAGRDRFATAAFDGGARVWRVEDGRPQTPELRHKESIYHLAVSAAGGRIATSSYDRTTKVWDSFTGALHGQPLEHADHVYHSSFSPDGSRIATASRDRTVRVWDPYRGISMMAPIHHPEALTRVLFTPDGHHLVSGSRDGDVNCRRVTPTKSMPLRLQHRDSVPLAVFDRNEPLLLTLSGEGRARLFDLEEGVQEGIAIPTPGKLVLAGPRINPRFADSFSARRVRSLLAKNVLPLMAAIDRSKAAAFALDPSFSRMLIGHSDGLVILWDLEKARAIHQTRLAEGGITCLDLEEDHALSGHADGVVNLFNPESGEIRCQVKHKSKVTSVVLDAEHSQFATGAMDNAARLWKLEDGVAKSPWLEHSDKASLFGTTCRFSPDGALLATGGSHDATLRLWRTSDGRPHLRPLIHDDFLTAFAFSHDGLRIATGTPRHDGQADVTVWDVATGVKLNPPLVHPEAILWLQFSQDDRFLASTSGDGTVLVSAQAPGGRLDDLPALAEWLVSRRLDETGSFQLPGSQPAESGRTWLRWFQESPGERAIAPGFSRMVKLPEPARNFGALRKALVDSPMDREIMVRLADALRTSSWPRHQIEADLYEKLAREKK